MTSLRRKSCTACVRSKRRCDLGLPACRRCAERRLSCLYPWTTAPETRLHDDATPTVVELRQRDAGTPISHFDLDNFLNTTDILDLPSNDTAELRFDQLASNSSELIPCLRNSAAISSIPRSLTPGMLSVIDALIDNNHSPIPPPSSLLSSLINNTTPTPSPARLITHDTSFDIGPTISGSQYQPRCEYAGRRFAQQAIDLARYGSTSFIHHSQISSETPITTTPGSTNNISSAAILQDALASSALFAIQNPVNAAVVRAYITQRATLLINTVNALLAHHPQTTTTTTPSPEIHLDLLQPVQALLIYQSIALFGRHHNSHSSTSSDITILAQAGRDEVHLKSWLQLLRRQLRPLQPTHHDSTSSSEGDIISNGDGGSPTQQQQQHSWKSWIHHESARRTVLYAETLISVHSFLQHGYDRGEARIQPLQYTAQTALWQARTAAEWRWTWDALPRCEVRFVSMEMDMLGIREEDCDELTVIMKVLVEGIDEVESWLGGKMMLLRRWGLRD